MEIQVAENASSFGLQVPSIGLDSAAQHSKALNLPSELTTQIFSILCHPVINDNLTRKASQPTTPLFLGSICRSWRAIIWDTPTLWCFVLIILSDKGKASPIRIKLLEDWLLRTRNLPLTLILTSIGHRSKSEAHWDLPPPNEVISLLVKHAEQWENVDMLLPNGYGGLVQKWNTILAEVVNRLPLLTSLSLRPPKTTGANHVRLDMFHSAPLLQHFTLDMYYVINVKVPWSQLVSLHVQRLSIQECLQILPWCHNLRRCQLDELFTTFVNDNSTAVNMQLEHLLSLKMAECEPRLISSILNGISCPALQELYLEPSETANEEIIPTLTSFFIRSSPVLKVLSLISYNDRTDKALFECLELIPSLETLILRPSSRLHPGITRWFLQKLDPSVCLESGSTIPLPNLQHFTFKGIFSHYRFGEFLEAIKNRWNKDNFNSSIKQLKVAAIEIHGGEDVYFNDKDRAVVEELLKAGMDITLERDEATT